MRFGGLDIPKDDGDEKSLKHKHKGNKTLDKKVKTKHHRKFAKHKHRKGKKIAKLVRRGLSA